MIIGWELIVRIKFVIESLQKVSSAPSKYY